MGAILLPVFMCVSEPFNIQLIDLSYDMQLKCKQNIITWTKHHFDFKYYTVSLCDEKIVVLHYLAITILENFE